MRLPDNSQRLVITGRTGSGKTQAGVWHLSRQNWKEIPWVIFNWKGDKLIAQLPCEKLALDKTPDKPGLYVVEPAPHQTEEVEAMLWRLWAREHCGIYVDEGYMLGKSNAYRAIQTQGRSKHIPTITLSQRPFHMDRFIFSEADFYQVFALNERNDRKRIAEWMPAEDRNGNAYDKDVRLDDFHSWYYDVGQNELAILTPVPESKVIVKSFFPEESTAIVDANPKRVRTI